MHPTTQLSPAIAGVLLGNDRSREGVLEAFRFVRATTEALATPLHNEDMIVQTMADVSPTKWHLAHVSWFFQIFVLEQWKCDYERPAEEFNYLFNSYYQQVGPQYPRPKRGWLSRPTVEEVWHYRRLIDDAVEALIDCICDTEWPGVADRLVLGLHHEQQHQELILSDIKHVLAQNPLFPTAYPRADARSGETCGEGSFVALEGAEYLLGREPGQGFCFDSETPSHPVLIADFELATNAVSNGEYCEFVEAGGYQNANWWPSDGWAMVCEHGWQHPLYWKRDGCSGWQEFTLHGMLDLDMSAPVCHLSWYEAQAYASFRQARLPTEMELEYADGLQQTGAGPEPLAVRRRHPRGGAMGEVWQWTGSAFLPYPGYRPPQGAIGEYNGKFMSGQMVLRGGSCLTPDCHVRTTYRNFFPPQAQWQMTGVRLARTP